MITAAQIKATAPHAWDGYVEALINGGPDLTAAGIITPLRLAHFLGQCLHETGGLSIVREHTGWTGEQMRQLWPQRFPLGKLDPRIIAAKGDQQALANVAYAKRTDLGNEGGDDGWAYRGGGFLQLTGRAAYRECGEALGLDLEGYPDSIEDPAISLKAALWVWGRDSLNRFADHNYGRTISNAINRGNPYSAHDPIGYKDRGRCFQTAWGTIGGGAPLPTGDLYLGAYGPKVARVQQELKGLGYHVGAIDGVLGPATARALAGFKLDGRRQGLDMEPDERVGPLTLAALESADPAPVSPERTDATVATLQATGSTEVAAGQRAGRLGQAALYTGAAAGASQLGLLEPLTSISGLQTTLAPVVTAVQWGLKHALWVLVLVGGVWLYIKGKDVITARLAAHRSGANLGR